MRNGDRIVCRNGKTYTVMQVLGSGGQGEVFRVKEEGTEVEYAFKLLNEKNSDKKRRKTENIKNLCRAYPRLSTTLEKKNFSFALPICIYESGNDFGYIMELCRGESINHMMLAKKFDSMPTKKRLAIVRRIAESADWLRGNGLCYQDFSHKNFMYEDGDRPWVSVIDCDNVAAIARASAGDARYVGGTGFYAAPEVAFRQANPGLPSDNFALATLFFKIMTGSVDSPYHGRELYTRPCRPESMFDAAFFTEDDPAFGRNWLTFVFDPANAVNRIDPALYRDPDYRERQEMICRNWAKVPPAMQKLFFRAFRTPLDPAAQADRPNAREWAHLAQDSLAVDDTAPPPALPKKKAPPSNQAGKTAPPAAPCAARVRILPGDHILPLACPIMLDAESTGHAIAQRMGEVQKQGDAYTFRSASPYLLKYYNQGAESGEIKKGETVPLSHGTELYFSVRPGERVKFLLR